jgi:hypothetical protein
MRWTSGLVVLLMSVAPGGSGTAATKAERKPGSASAETKSGPNGGVTVKLGPYLGEFRVWEKFVEFFVYDDAGKPVLGKDVKGTLEVVPKGAPRPSRLEVPRPGFPKDERPMSRASDPSFAAPTSFRTDLQPRGDRLTARVAVTKFTAADLKVAVTVRGEKLPEASAAWTKENDRSRLGDWNRPPW